MQAPSGGGRAKELLKRTFEIHKSITGVDDLRDFAMLAEEDTDESEQVNPTYAEVRSCLVDKGRSPFFPEYDEWGVDDSQASVQRNFLRGR